jgi:hypothetical protein
MRGAPAPPIQARARDLILRLLPAGMERAFILRWLEPRAKKAEARAQLKAEKSLSPWGKVVELRRRSRNSLLTRADDAFSILVRTIGTHIGSDGRRWGACVTCPPETPYKLFADLQAGHCIKRGQWGTRYNTNNCHPQCRNCNNPARGNGRVPEHLAYIAAHHGDGVISRLGALAKLNPRRPSDLELRELAERFKQMTTDHLVREGGK